VRLTKLSDIRGLRKLPGLRDLTFVDCPNLNYVDSLLEIPSLEGLTLWGCRDKAGAIAKVVPALERRKLRELMVT
jgi:hypothetical protein